MVGPGHKLSSLPFFFSLNFYFLFGLPSLILFSSFPFGINWGFFLVKLKSSTDQVRSSDSQCRSHTLTRRNPGMGGMRH